VLTKWRGFDEEKDTEEPLDDKWIDTLRLLKDHLLLLGDQGDALAIQGLRKIKEWEDNPGNDLPDSTGDTYPTAMTMVRQASFTSKHSTELVSCYGALLCETRIRVPYRV
jgi:hypothetical protein